MVPGYNENLARNFNHLMFADNLILVTRASRQSARNIKLFLNIYQNLTGQKLNLLKSEIFFPTWCNKKIRSTIAWILGIKIGSFPLTYLGIPISPKKLLVNLFQLLQDRVRNSIQARNHSTILLPVGLCSLIVPSFQFLITTSLSCIFLKLLSMKFQNWLETFSGVGQAIEMASIPLGGQLLHLANLTRDQVFTIKPMLSILL